MTSPPAISFQLIEQKHGLQWPCNGTLENLLIYFIERCKMHPEHIIRQCAYGFDFSEILDKQYGVVKLNTSFKIPIRVVGDDNIFTDKELNMRKSCKPVSLIALASAAMLQWNTCEFASFYFYHLLQNEETDMSVILFYRACYDLFSSSIRYPFYAHVATECERIDLKLLVFQICNTCHCDWDAYTSTKLALSSQSYMFYIAMIFMRYAEICIRFTSLEHKHDADLVVDDTICIKMAERDNHLLHMFLKWFHHIFGMECPDDINDTYDHTTSELISHLFNVYASIYEQDAERTHETSSMLPLSPLSITVA